MTHGIDLRKMPHRLEIRVKCKFVVLLRSHDAHFLILPDPFFKEVSFALQRNGFHEVEWIDNVVSLGTVQLHQEPVRHKLDVLDHQLIVHSNQSHGKSFSQELTLNVHSILDDIQHSLLSWFVDQMFEEKTSKVSVKAFVSGDQLIGKGEAGHQTSLLQPENGSKTSTEEDPLNQGKGNKSLSIGCIFCIDPPQSPLCLLLDRWNGLNGAEHLLLLFCIFDVGVNEEGVHLAVDVFNGNLESIEAAGLWDLNLAHEMFYQIFIDNSVRCSKESKDMFDKVPFIVCQSVPISEVPGQVNFFSSPETGLGLLVHSVSKGSSRVSVLLNSSGVCCSFFLGVTVIGLATTFLSPISRFSIFSILVKGMVTGY